MSMVASTSQLVPAQPSPSYILRGHSAQISVLNFSLDCHTLYSGDVEGWVSVWDLKTFRPRLFWKAHEAGLLTIEEWNGGILTHGRDNKVHFFLPPTLTPSITRTPATSVPSPKSPTPLSPEWSMDINAMAFSKMSLLRLSNGEALIAVPALTKDDMIDIFHIPSMARVHRSIGAGLFPIGDKTGTIMSLVLYLPTDTAIGSSSSSTPTELHLLAGYEDGRVAHFSFTGSAKDAFDPPTAKKDESQGWKLLWDDKGHREALMDIALSPDRESCWSVGADHFICKYNLNESDLKLKELGTTRLTKYETTAPGRSSIGIRDDGKLLAVAGWDGELRLYSTKTGSPLAVLSYHRSSLHALAFGRSISRRKVENEEDDEEDDTDDEEDLAVEVSSKITSGRDWLATGGKDDRISLWEVYSR